MPQQTLHHAFSRYGVAVVVVALAAAVRLWPLHVLDPAQAWLTFYPAVLVAAIWGGLLSGLLATTLACLAVMFLSPSFGLQTFNDNVADWLAMLIFTLTGAMISGLTEAALRANARATDAEAQADAARRAKSVFLATMSHELRTPLNAILGFSDLMRGDPNVTPGQLENLAIINRSGQHLLELISDVPDMAKIEAGQVFLQVRPFDIAAQVHDVVDLLRAQAEEKNLRLLLDMPPDFPRCINGDEEKLHRVIINLVTNAIKYTHQGDVRLSLAFRQNGVPRLVIEVKDTGVGISAADHARIFEPFVQVGSHKGTGLGLTIVREFVKVMGGQIRIESEPGKGTVFRVDVPVQIAEDADIVPPEFARERVIGLEPGQPEFRIMIVEDQLENQMLLRRVLENVGFTVKLATNGAEAVELFQSYRPHFIWMDRRMPVMDGLEATQRIRALEGGKDVKIALLSASMFTEQSPDMKTSGLDDNVRKPFLPREIFECMARLLGVRFVYETPEIASDAAALPTAALAQLPENLRQELTDALIDGHSESIAELVARIEQQDAALAKTLGRHLDRFDYLPVLQALETANTQN